MFIREASPNDWGSIWPFFHSIVKAGETFAYDPNMSKEDGRATWMVRFPGHVAVAVSDDMKIMGTANMYANRSGPGAHVSSASFMVDPKYQGQGVGRALCQYTLGWCREQGFRSVQFNAVVDKNVAAVELYKSLGFEVIGTVPEAFLHPKDGFVGLHVMYRRL